MNKEELCGRIENGEKFFQYIYEVETGKENLRKYECKINKVHDDGFETLGFGFHVPFDYFGKWNMKHWSSNLYEYFIFLTCDEDIEEYLGEIKKRIAERIQKEIEELQKSLVLVI